MYFHVKVDYSDWKKKAKIIEFLKEKIIKARESLQIFSIVLRPRELKFTAGKLCLTNPISTVLHRADVLRRSKKRF